MRLNRFISILQESGQMSLARSPKINPANYQIAGNFSNVDQWRVKILAGNSLREGQKVGDWDTVGYVMVNAKRRTFVPIAHADEHHTGWDLMHQLRVSDLDNYYPVHNGSNYADSEGSIQPALTAYQGWLDHGGPDLLVTGPGYNGQKKFMLRMSEYIRDPDSAGTIPAGELTKFGKDFVRAWAGVSKAVAQAYRLGDAGRDTGPALKSLLRATAVLRPYLRVLEQNFVFPFLYKTMPQLDPLLQAGDIQKLAEFLLGTAGVKNQIHQAIRDHLAKPPPESFPVKYGQLFGDLEVFDQLMGRSGQERLGESVIDVEGTRVWKNPSLVQIANILRRGRSGECKVLLSGTDLYAWDGWEHHHADVLRKLGLPFVGGREGKLFIRDDGNLWLNFNHPEMNGDTGIMSDRGLWAKYHEDTLAHPVVQRLIGQGLQIPEYARPAPIPYYARSDLTKPLGETVRRVHVYDDDTDDDPFDLTVLINPTPAEVRALLDQCDWKCLRGAASGDRLYLWKAEAGNHVEVLPSLGMTSFENSTCQMFFQGQTCTIHHFGASAPERVRSQRYKIDLEWFRTSPALQRALQGWKIKFDDSKDHLGIMEAVRRIEVIPAGGRPRTIRLWMNPTASQLKALTENSRNDALRGLLLGPEHIAVWEAYDATHDAVGEAFLDEFPDPDPLGRRNLGVYLDADGNVRVAMFGRSEQSAIIMGWFRSGLIQRGSWREYVNETSPALQRALQGWKIKFDDSKDHLGIMEANEHGGRNMTVGAKKKLMLKYGRLTTFAQMPRPYQLAIAHYMAVDGEMWEAPSLINMRYRPEEAPKQLLRDLPGMIRKYGGKKFLIAEVPTEVIEAAMRGIYKDAYSFPEYGRATTGRFGEIHPITDRWPAIVSPESDEFLQDGNHRFSVYRTRGDKTIPLVMYV